MTRTMRLRFVAMAGSGLLAATTMLGAVALQGGHQENGRPGEEASRAVEGDAPIVYAGGFGLFPSGE